MSSTAIGLATTPCQASGPTVTSYAGPIISSGKVYLVCYGWDCTAADATYQFVTGSTTGTQGWLQVFLANIGGTKYLNGFTQYSQPSPSLFIGNTVSGGGSWSSSRIYVDNAKKIAGDTCSSNADCDSGFCYTYSGQSKCIGYCAVNKDCLAPVGCQGRCSCTTSADCPAGNTCVSGACNNTLCTTTADCASGTCVSKTCRCKNDNDCSVACDANFKCTSPASCSTNTDCTFSLGCDASTHGCHCLGDADCGGVSGACLGSYCQNVTGRDVERSAWRARANFDSTNAGTANNVYMVVGSTRAMDQGLGSFHGYSDTDPSTSYRNYYAHVVHAAYDGLPKGAIAWEEIVESYAAGQGFNGTIAYYPEIVDACSGGAAQDVALDSSSFRFGISAYVSNLANSGAGACINARANRFDQFAAAGGNIWHSSGTADGYSASWSPVGSKPTGYAPTGKVGAISWVHDRVDVYGADSTTTSVLDHVYWNGSIWQWDQTVSLPSGCGGYLQGVDVTSTQPGLLDILVSCSSSGGGITLYHKRWQPSSYSSWHTVGSGVTGYPIAVERAAIAATNADTLRVFARESTGGYIEENDSGDGGATWGGWGFLGSAPAGKTLTGSIDVAGMSSPGSVADLVVADTGGLIHWLHINGLTATWDTALPGAPSGTTMKNPSIANEGDGRIWVSAIDTGTTNIYHWTYDFAAGSWTLDNYGQTPYAVDSTSW